MPSYHNRQLKSRCGNFTSNAIPGSLLEPANPHIHTHSTPAKSTVLETLAEIACLIASGIVGWIAYGCLLGGLSMETQKPKCCVRECDSRDTHEYQGVGIDNRRRSITFIVQLCELVQGRDPVKEGPLYLPSSRQSRFCARTLPLMRTGTSNRPRNYHEQSET